MCPFIDSSLFEGKAEKKTLTVSLSDGESILASIGEAMKQHGIKECSVAGIEGKIKEGVLSFFERSKCKAVALKSRPVLRASGSFKLNFGNLWGDLHISTAEKKPQSGTLTKGTAEEGLEIKLSFLEEKKQ